MGSNQNQFAVAAANLRGTMLKPLGKSGGARRLEGVYSLERSFLIAVGVDRRMESGELQHTSHGYETLQIAFTSSEV